MKKEKKYMEDEDEVEEEEAEEKHSDGEDWQVRWYNTNTKSSVQYNTYNPFIGK